MKVFLGHYIPALSIALLCSPYASAQFYSKDPGVRAPLSGVTGSRDEAAIEVIENSLAVQGGRVLWHNNKSIKLSGMLQDAPSTSEESPVTIEYDWTGKSLRFRAETERGGRHVVRASTPEAGVRILANERQKDLSKQVQPRKLPPEVPALSFLLALDNPDFSISLLSGCPINFDCVRISPLTKKQVNAVGSEDWFIEKSTHLPDHVSTYAADQIHRGILLQTTWNIKSYQTIQGVEVPATLTMEEMGVGRDIKFTSVSLSQSASPRDFDLTNGGRQ